MKNTIKKAICTALTAVSLSAMVTVPSSLNTPASDKAIVNVMEVKAENAMYDAYLTKGKNYYIRTSRDKNTTSNIKWIAYPYYKFKVYEEVGNWVRITPKGKAKEWIWKDRVHRKPSFLPHSCTYQENSECVYIDKIHDHIEISKRDIGIYNITYYHRCCKVCGNELTPEIILIQFNPAGNKPMQYFNSLENCPGVIKQTDLMFKKREYKK